ncbi:isochorismate synthase [Kineococcus sp. SYSU DK005]|uniref:isochorismate synthase n=1 Tax=Kineococcus sp. SYSU DK005 TaxID=3383126 RepID=UPI003D7DD421
MRTSEPPPPAGDAAGRAVGGVADLLAAYRPGTTAWFSAGGRHLLAGGSRARIGSTAGAGPALAAQVDAVLRADRRSGGPGLAVGAVPFAAGTPAALRVPERLLRATGAPPPAPAPAPVGRGATTRSTPDDDGYAAAVATAVQRLRAGDDRLGKVVLGRLLEADLPGGVDVPAVLARLLAADPEAFVYAVDVPPLPPLPPLEPTGPAAAARTAGAPVRTLLGASPELLVSRRGRRVSACPLAGSAPRCDDPHEDAARAAALLRSAKDLHEHAVVADAVRAALAPLCRELDVPATPQVRGSAALWHLATPVSGVLADPATTSLDLLAALHPTPAVCGVPVAAARDLIGELEPFERGYATGAVGWCDADGDGEWAVTIRCAEVQGGSVRLFAGAGVVAASDPRAELAETAAKFRTSARALGIEW